MVREMTHDEIVEVLNRHVAELRRVGDNQGAAAVSFILDLIAQGVEEAS